MTRIHISAEAYAALCHDVAEDSRLLTQASSQGGFFVWLDKRTAERLKAAREPGEGYSEAILRLAELERT